MARRSSTGGRSSRRVRAGRRFFDRPTTEVARALLGAELVVVGGRRRRVVRLVETEAYLRGDPASHAYAGPTRRNRSMFLGPGTLYVFRIHQVVCANLVTRQGTAVLLRAAEPHEGITGSTVGPGRLCRALGLTIADDGRDAVSDPKLWVLERRSRRERVLVGPRVGLRRAAERPLRFYLEGNRWVSRPRGPVTSASPTRSRGVAGSPRSRTRRRRPSAGGTNAGRTVGR
jgi:DNA-3-methyladenine glycosylase